MKIKCVSCNEKTISFWEGFKNRGNVVCPLCNSNLKLESNKAYRPLAFLNILLIFYIVFKTEDGTLKGYLGYLIIFTTFLLTLFVTSKTTLSNQSTTKLEVKKNNWRNLITLIIVSSVILYSWLLQNSKLNAKSPLMLILAIITFFGPLYLAYRVIKENKK